MAFFGLYCLTLCVHAFLLNATTANSVETMNRLLAKPGWITLDTCAVRDGEKYLAVSHLLASSSSTPIVTNENVNRKIRLAYQFLTCNFVDELRQYYGHVRGVGPQCELMDSPLPALQCLEKYLRMIEDGEQLVLLVRNALARLSQLTWHAVLYNAGIAEFLEYTRTYYEGKTLDVDSSEEQRAKVLLSDILAVVEVTNKEMSEIERRLSELFASFCRRRLTPPPCDVQPTTSDLNRQIDEIYKSASQIRDRFLRFFKEPFGFHYNPDTLTVRLI